MSSSGMLRCVALVRTNVSEELSASIIRVTRIGDLGTTLAVTSTHVFGTCCLLLPVSFLSYFFFTLEDSGKFLENVRLPPN
jgi:hypothetical protein